MAKQDPDSRPPSKGSRLTVRFDEVEDAQLRERALAMGVGTSTLVRAMTLDALGAGHVPTRLVAAVAPSQMLSVDAGELRQLRTELNRAGVNVNQIARGVNGYGAPFAGSPEALSSLQELLVSVQAVEDMLGGVQRA